MSTTLVKNAKRRHRSRRRLYTTNEAAEHLGISPSTLKRWRKTKGAPSPTLSSQQGGIKVWLYTAQDLKDCLRYAEEPRRGPVAGGGSRNGH